MWRDHGAEPSLTVGYCPARLRLRNLVNRRALLNSRATAPLAAFED